MFERVHRASGSTNQAGGHPARNDQLEWVTSVVVKELSSNTMIAADRSRRRKIAWIAAAIAGIMLALFLAFKVRSSIAAGRAAREARLAIAAGLHRQAKAAAGAVASNGAHGG